MSYGSTFVQFEANGRMSQKFSRPSIRKDEPSDRSHKLVQYEKQFDVNLSRVDEPPIDKTSVRNSMLRYSKKMRSIQDARNGKGDSLFVRAKHIPKNPTRGPIKRRPMSYDELLGRDRDTVGERPGAAKARPHSDKTKPLRHPDTKKDTELHLPLLTERYRKSGKNVQVSLVSASDLYDIVDFSIRSKGTRNESLQMLRMEQSTKSRDLKNHRKNQSDEDTEFEAMFPEDAYNNFERTPNKQADTKTAQRMKNVQTFFENSFTDGNMPSVEFYERIFAMDKTELPSLTKTVTQSSPLKLPSIEPFKRRPQRAKRMKLVDPGLDDIPEDNIIESNSPDVNTVKEIPRVASPAPQKTSPKPHENMNRFSLDAIQENVEKVSVKDGEESTEKNTNLRNHDERVSTTSHNSFPKRGVLQSIEDTKKSVIRDDGDVRIEVTQCPPKHDGTGSVKLKAQKRFKRLIYLRDAPR